VVVHLLRRVLVVDVFAVQAHVVHGVLYRPLNFARLAWV
jgi:hypothetical protein